jgi:hypothetical protein
MERTDTNVYDVWGEVPTVVIGNDRMLCDCAQVCFLQLQRQYPLLLDLSPMMPAS